MEQQRMEMVEFGVAGLADVRTLLNRWKAVLAGLARESGPSLVMKTYRQVGIEVEDRRPGKEVLLTFLAPKAILARFLADLRNQGLEVTEEPLIPGVVLTCRLKPRNLH
jgi:hypothetical protein